MEEKGLSEGLAQIDPGVREPILIGHDPFGNPLFDEFPDGLPEPGNETTAGEPARRNPMDEDKQFTYGETLEALADLFEVPFVQSGEAAGTKTALSRVTQFVEHLRALLDDETGGAA